VLIGAAKSAECAGSNAGAVRGPSVIPSKCLVVYGEGDFAKDECSRCLSPQINCLSVSVSCRVAISSERLMGLVRAEGSQGS
jgi:hypothetical protein